MSEFSATDESIVSADVASDIPGVSIIEEALSGSLFERLARGVRAVGDERIKKNYTTTFWFPREAAASNVAEESVEKLAGFVPDDVDWVGAEWWLGRLPRGKKLRFHFDRDMTVRKQTGRFVHPLIASALYLNAFPESPMVILDQVPSNDGKARVPAKPERRKVVVPAPNRYVTFPGNLRHGVMPRENAVPEPGDELRLSLLVNFWRKRPLPPLCFDYDGKIYPSLSDV